MAKKSKHNQPIEKSLGKIEETLSNTEKFVEKHYKNIFYGILTILALIVLYFAYQKYIKKPIEKEAKDNIYMAQWYFQKNDYTNALHGDGNNDGFLSIIDEYGSTKVGKLANFYAGICYRELEDYTNAITYLEYFKSKDFYLSSLKYSAIADCYYSQGNYEDAAKKYEKAATINPNNYTTPTYLFRAGFAYDKIGYYNKALQLFEMIEKKYTNSVEGKQITQYITYIKMKMKE